MNSVHTQNIDELTDSHELERKLKLMEDAGVAWEDRAAAAIEFLETRKENSRSEQPGSEPDPADEELTFDDDPSTSEQDASGTEPHANRSEPASDPNANQSGQRSEPEPEPELPPPPKFQFGVGNPLYEAALDFRAYRDKRSILDRLTDTQRRAIFMLLEHYSEEKVADLLAKAPPAGLSIRVSRAALNRFGKRYQKQERRRNSVNFLREFERLFHAADGDDQAFLVASERLLKMRLYQITGDPNSSLETVTKLTGVITTLRKQALAERKQLDAGKPK